VKLFSKAIVRQLENGRLANEVDGAYIAYDNRTEVANVRNDASGQSKPGQGRNTLIIAPRRTTAAPAAGGPAAAPPAAAPAAAAAPAGKQ
jgi:lipopolysaccharide export system protein LptA